MYSRDVLVNGCFKDLHSGLDKGEAVAMKRISERIDAVERSIKRQFSIGKYAVPLEFLLLVVVVFVTGPIALAATIGTFYAVHQSGIRYRTAILRLQEIRRELLMSFYGVGGEPGRFSNLLAKVVDYYNGHDVSWPL